MLKYQKYLPYLDDNIASNIIKTPLVKAQRLGEYLSINNLYLKLDSTLPFSHTFKDRGATTAISEIIKQGKKIVMCASCGNMSSAVAPIAAKAGLKCFVILSSEATNSNKLAMQYTGAEIFEFEGRFDEIDNLIADFSSQNPEIPCINTNLQKTYMLGLKSLYFELFDDLANKYENVNIIVPTADGTLIHALHLAYLEYKNDFPEIKFYPRFIIAQPQNCAPIVTAFEKQTKIIEWNKNIKTSVLSLSVDYPLLNGENALIAVRETKGTSIAVNEMETIENCKLLAETEGIFTDDVGGIVIGALKQLKKENLLNDNPTVCLLTGNGLKTVEKFYNSYSKQNEKYNSVSDFLNQIKNL